MIDYEEYERMIMTLLWQDEGALSRTVQKWAEALADFPRIQRLSEAWLERVVSEAIEGDLRACPAAECARTAVLLRWFDLISF